MTGKYLIVGVIGLVMVLALIVGIVDRNGNNFDPLLQCVSDEDCVPASCCHPSEAINERYAPDCKGVSCTQECRPGTMDCGCGHVACVNQKCGVVWTKNYEWC